MASLQHSPLSICKMGTVVSRMLQKYYYTPTCSKSGGGGGQRVHNTVLQMSIEKFSNTGKEGGREWGKEASIFEELQLTTADNNRVHIYEE